MAVKNVNLDDVSYAALTPDKEIVIDVEIGDAADESGSYAIFLGKVLVGANKPAHVGTKTAVAGKVSTVSVTIIDMLKETNWTSMTLWVKEAGQNKRYGPYSDDHDTIVYTLKLNFQ